jgi:lipopolysaccharide/colanic/teichoic acid biosynthesis glycosyltransferase
LLIAYIITGLWFITSIFTQKFQKNGYQKNIWYYISPFIKSLILIIFGLSISLFLLKYYHLSRFELFGTLLIFGLLELTIFSTYYLIGKSESRNGDIESIEEIQKITKQKLLNIDENDQLDEYCVSPSLEYLLESDKRELYEFINSNIDVVNIPNNSLTVLDTRTDINIVNLKSESISLLINLHKLNDIRWINRYLLTLYEKVSIGGYIVGNLQTNEQYKEQFFCKMPSYLARVLFIPNFIFRRAIPKLPFFKQIYFSLTDGKNRALSKAEVFGRLHFCGYSVIAEKEINKHLWFISRKVKTISADQNPSYSPLIKLPRVGLNGNTIYLYKIRTMHPYSEYLQEYIYKNNLLDEKGKIKNDFRVTGWGKLLRKLWIDELPQIINWWRGDVSLVGVRALSHHFFDLYPEDMQKLRVQFKPGLVPPYYADMPRTFDEIVESERNYLLRKKEKPFTTDVIYFFKAFYNILFKHARSR